jgi:hypothetical protein
MTRSRRRVNGRWLNHNDEFSQVRRSSFRVSCRSIRCLERRCSGMPESVRTTRPVNRNRRTHPGQGIEHCLAIADSQRALEHCFHQSATDADATRARSNIESLYLAGSRSFERAERYAPQRFAGVALRQQKITRWPSESPASVGLAQCGPRFEPAPKPLHTIRIESRESAWGRTAKSSDRRSASGVR